VFFSLRDKDKESMLALAKDLQRMGYGVSATTGTANFFNDRGVNCLSLKKVDEGRPHCVDKIRSGEVAFVINTTSGRRAIEASFDIRRACTDYNIPCLTESDAAEAFILALKNTRNGTSSVEALHSMEAF
jgi:carbamoyl-phosphate synthase large subunit